MIQLEDVSVVVRVPGRPGEGWASRQILGGINLALTEPRIAVVGANGSGKSTLLRLLNGLVAPTTGSVRINGVNVSADPKRARSMVGFIFTDPLSQLVMPTPVEDVELSLRRTIRDRGQRRAAALALLAERGLADLADQSIYDLSGGERQLVALASVMAVEPQVLVADEPTTLLDLRNRQLMRRAFADLPQQMIVATHDLEMASDAERVVVVEDGRVAFDGQPVPAIDFYRELMGS